MGWQTYQGLKGSVDIPERERVPKPMGVGGATCLGRYRKEVGQGVLTHIPGQPQGRGRDGCSTSSGPS